MKPKYGMGKAAWSKAEEQRADERRRRFFLSNAGKLPDYSAWQIQREQFYAYANRCAFAGRNRLDGAPRS